MKYFILTLLLYAAIYCRAQSTYGLTDGRSSGYVCGEYTRLLAQKPREVLFGIHINNLHEVFFSITSREWFDKLFTGSEDGVAVDLVAKDQYSCGKQPPKNNIPKGHLLKPVYRNALLAGLPETKASPIYIKVGVLPEKLYNKELEGNLILVKNGVICFYTWFTDIDRSLWDILDMGLFTDTLVNNTRFTTEDKTTIYTNTFTQKFRFLIPFRAADAIYDADSVAAMNRILLQPGQKIKKIDIRAYSSVDGSEEVNIALQQKRAAVMVKLMQRMAGNKVVTTVNAHANWLDFDDDLRNGPYHYLTKLPHAEVRKALKDRNLLTRLEKYLTRHRKAVITVYVDQKKTTALTDSTVILRSFRDAIARKDTGSAQSLLQEVYERIADNSLPAVFLNQLEIPGERSYSGLLADEAVYKYLLRLTNAEEALDELRKLRARDSINGKINYNICALSLRQWKLDTGYLKPAILLSNIRKLEQQGIHPSLVRRMLVNFHILLCEYYTAKSLYAAKDSALTFIRNNYAGLQLDDEGLVSLAKYFEYYSKDEWAEQALVNRAGSIDAAENLLFYFVTLRMIHTEKPITDMVLRAIHNAMNINPQRFCTLFNSVNNGGSSFQLLNFDQLRAFYCERCQ